MPFIPFQSMRISNVIVKTASRCNLNCTYCYMYNQGDETFLKQPKFMSYDTIESMAQKISDHCVEHNLQYFEITFHGGEPLLAPPELYRFLVAKCKAIIPDSVKLGFSMQTNGTLLDDEWCKLFKELKIKVGFSMDGTRDAHDMYRVDHKGRGSYEKVVKGIKIYQKNNPKSGGVLSVLNIEEDPIEIYENLKSLNIPSYGILLPDVNYLTAVKNNFDLENDPIRMADWFIRLFDHWYNDQDTNKPNIRNFINLIDLIIGRTDQGTEATGIGKNDVLVIETDGGLEATDPLKTCGHGFTKDGLNIKTHSISDALNSRLIRLYQNSHYALTKKCRVCPILNVCGGGYLPHRYHPLSGFNNTTVYCDGLIKLITHIQNRIIDLLPVACIDELQIEKYSEIDVRTAINLNLSKAELEDPELDELLESFKVN
ncbi:radical SAM protein [Sediminibacterium sp.]|jgi:uncharacterized protein|uniref:radical SAM protein n=1 Tax=Sediminibacterium sp. TaxID=1917865 RepID=UPI003F71398F